MIIYGSRKVHLKTVQCSHVTCQNCNLKGSIRLSIYRKHVHIFWIPMFPVGKKGVSICQNCNEELSHKEMPEELHREYVLLKTDARGPIWQFVGLFLILVIAIWANFQSDRDTKRELGYIKEPAVNDIYAFKNDEREYSTMKIVDIKSDTLYFVYNNFTVRKYLKIGQIDMPENYSDSVYFILKTEIEQRYKNDDFLDVKRNDP